MKVETRTKEPNMLEQNKAVIRRLNEEFWNKRNAKAFDEAIATPFVDHNPMPGTEGSKEDWRKVAIGIQAAFPDGRSTIDDLVAEDDKVTWRWTFRGTHKGPFMGIPATGKTVTITGITIDRLAGGQIVERWSHMDSLGMMQQLGAIPPSR